MRTTGLLSLLDNEDFAGYVMDTLGRFLDQDHMSSLQAVNSISGFLTGLEEVRQKIDGIRDAAERKELLTWYCFYLYLWGIKKETLKVVLGR